MSTYMPLQYLSMNDMYVDNLVCVKSAVIASITNLHHTRSHLCRGELDPELAELLVRLGVIRKECRLVVGILLGVHLQTRARISGVESRESQPV